MVTRRRPLGILIHLYSKHRINRSSWFKPLHHICKEKLMTYHSKTQDALDQLLSQMDYGERVAADPIRFPKRYKNQKDQELVALFSALLAYGRVKSIGECLERLFDSLGDSPATLAMIDAQNYRLNGCFERRFPDFVYRFTRENDLNKLWIAVGEIFIRYENLGQCFMSHDQAEDSSLISAYQGFYNELNHYSKGLIGGRGFNHLVSDPKKGSALKRINMFLRWMVRGPDQVDLGLWSNLGSHRLIIPLDVHVFRLSSALALTQRRTPDLKTALEITKKLREFDPIDPIKYDFAIAHLGISGACKGHRILDICQKCPLNQLCSLA